MRHRALRIAVLIAAQTCSMAAAGVPDADQQARLDALRAAGTEASVTILPVILGKSPFVRASNVLGLMLEQNGATNACVVETAFTHPADAEAENIPGLLAEYLQANPVETDYVLFAEFLGSPGKGVAEVRTIIVDKEGRLVWLDRQRPGDEHFDRVKPGCPMSCCVLAVERLSTIAEPNPSGAPPEGEGKFATLFANEAGSPDKTERKAIEQRTKLLAKAGRGAKVLLHPALVNNETDRACAEHLAGLLNEAGLCTATLADTAPALKAEYTPNEQKRLWDVANAFRDYVRDNPPDADYALYTDYLFNPRGAAHSVHFIVCDRDGDWVIVDFQNDHWEDFQSIAPKNPDDCNRLVVRRMEGHMK
jgi:hypothetical protein